VSAFSQALSVARAAEREEKAARQGRKLEQHLSTHGIEEVESFSGALHFVRSFPPVSPHQFNCIIETVRKRKSRTRSTV
jgi:hypothetical protein